MKLAAWRDRARALKSEVYALTLAARDPRTPMLAKLLAGLVIAYALSPIDLIPDFIPVLGYLDDLLLLPLGVWLVLKLVPPEAMSDARAQAQMAEGKPSSWLGALLVIGLWVGAIALVAIWLVNLSR